MTLFSRASHTLRRGLQRSNVVRRRQAVRHMGGGGGFLQTSEVHTQAGEIFGVLCWLWVFHRARYDLPVVLGWRHPWEHGDDHGPAAAAVTTVHAEPAAPLEEKWESFTAKAAIQSDEEDEEDEDDDDE